jgi:hypothetical protein
MVHFKPLSYGHQRLIINETLITLIFIEITMAQNGTDVVYLREGTALIM